MKVNGFNPADASKFRRALSPKKVQPVSKPFKIETREANPFEVNVNDIAERHIKGESR